MTEEKTSKKIVKATLEAVFQAQEKLRKHLGLLIEENRPLKDNAERDLFFRELTYSTLGLGKNLIVQYNVKNSYIGLRKDVETVARWLAYQQTEIVYVPLELFKTESLDNRGKIGVEIKDLWHMLLEHFFSVFPLAIDRATSLSKEQPEQGKSKGFMVEND